LQGNAQVSLSDVSALVVNSVFQCFEWFADLEN